MGCKYLYVAKENKSRKENLILLIQSFLARRTEPIGIERERNRVRAGRPAITVYNLVCL